LTIETEAESTLALSQRLKKLFEVTHKLDRQRIIRCLDERFGAIMTEKTDAIFLLALLILTIVGLAVSSATHAEDASFPTEQLR
jgi:hypothetical protein